MSDANPVSEMNPPSMPQARKPGLAPMPKTVKVGGHIYRIVRKPKAEMYDPEDAEHSHLMGLCRFNEVEIWIQKGLRRTKAQEILYHELTHACSYPTMSDVKGITDEQFVDAVSPAVVQMLQENPQLVKFITQK